MENEQYQPTQPNDQNDFQHASMPEHYSAPDYRQTPEHPHHSSAGTIVLQWMTYALWGWTVFAMSFLTGSVIASYISDTRSDSLAVYAVAAVLVLLPMALVCDLFYSKREPAKKTGGASVVLIIHAVIFALLAIGSLITVVFSIISMFVESGDKKSWQIALYSALIIAVLYGATLLRTINPPRFARFKRFFPIFMITVVGILTILAFTGPVKKTSETKTDRLIEDNISQLADSVSNYTQSAGKLPASLNDIQASGDVKKLIDDNLVVYKPNTKPQTVNDSSQTSVYYQLCVTYKKSANENTPDYTPAGEYQPYISAYSHRAGQVCYKATTSYSSSSVQ